MRCFFKIISLFLLLFLVACGLQKRTGKETLKNKIDWEGYSVKSSYDIDKISENNFQGKWYAFRRSYGRTYKIFDEINCPQPYVAEIKGSAFKINADSAFIDFKLSNNKIILPNKYRIDTAVINLLTNDSLILTWKYSLYDPWEKKESLFYQRYFYKRSPKP